LSAVDCVMLSLRSILRGADPHAGEASDDARRIYLRDLFFKLTIFKLSQRRDCGASLRPTAGAVVPRYAVITSGPVVS